MPQDCSGPQLTHSELRLLPLLATGLSFREISALLDVPRETIQTEARSVYRKLGIVGRDESADTRRHLRLAAP